MLNKKILLKIEQYINEKISVSESKFSFSIHELAESCIPEIKAREEISDYINEHLEDSFQKLLFHHIDQQGLKDSDVYKKAGVDRRLFSKIRSNVSYRPSKNTTIALALALELNITQGTKLLKSVGYSLSCSDKFDLVIRFCFEQKIYDYMDVNEALDHFNEKMLVN